MTSLCRVLAGVATLCATSGATADPGLRLLPDFAAEVVYTVPLAEQGSWVAMTFDGRGRIYASAQQGSIYRLSLPRPGQAGPPKVERVELPVGECQGMLWAEQSLYCVANGTHFPSGLYRLRDTDRDDRLDRVDLLTELPDDRGRLARGLEHGPHGIVRGPDRALYVIGGNNTAPPPADPTAPYRNWSEDLLLPRRPDGRGHNTGVLAPGGWVARTDLQGRSWRILAGGLRNAYDIAFNQHGELFTFDSDMEWDIGTSWYRPTRINHVISGAEFGWRFGTGKWPADYVDSFGAVVDVGRGSPTGVAFGHGARFPARYQRALYALDWSYGRVLAIHLEPDGASYRGAVEVFASGQPLPVADCAVGPDGAFYFVTGGRGTQSRIYRIGYTGRESTRPARDLDDPAARRARALRRRLEALHGRPVPGAMALAWPHLGSPDRALRHAARVALEHQPRATWQARALAEPRPEVRVAALVSLVRNASDPRHPAPDRSALAGQVLAALDALPLERLAEGPLVDALRAYALTFVRLGRPDPVTLARVTARLDPLYPHASARINRELVQLLVYLEAPQVVPRTMALLEQAPTQPEQVHYVFVLRTVKHGWTLPSMRSYFRWLRKAVIEYKGGASWLPFMVGIRQDALASFVDAAHRRLLADLLDDEPAPDEPQVLAPRRFVKDWRMEDLEDALPAADAGRSFERGRAAMRVAQCLRCHRFNEEGTGLGPDLSAVGARFTSRELLESIILPSKVMSDQYQQVQILTRSGDAYVGAVMDETATELVLRPHPFSEDTVRVAKADITSRELSATSMMPEGLLSMLERDEILDLLAYLRSAGRADHPAFRPAPGP